jgi:hypothetical protein
MHKQYQRINQETQRILLLHNTFKIARVTNRVAKQKQKMCYNILRVDKMCSLNNLDLRVKNRSQNVNEVYQ